MECNRCRDYWNQDGYRRDRYNDYRRDHYNDYRRDRYDNFEYRRIPRPYREDRRYSPRSNLYGFPRIY